MREDRTLVLQLRAEGEGGALGDAQIELQPDDPRYAEVLAHLGALEPGDTRAVPPFPEPPSSE